MVLVLGAVTAVLGILFALMQDDLKRVLAYSTIENIGLIFVGLGLALAFRANAMPGAAALAFTAALFHVLNHSAFKSLLFFGSGAVLTATGTRTMDRLGGLIHRMPLTAFAVLAGAAAIAALPPLNGFVSEWLTFQAVLLSPDLPQWDLKIIVPAAGAMLALAAALAAACFVRLYGVSFLGRPRSIEAAEAREVDRWSVGVMLGLAALCLAPRHPARLRHRRAGAGRRGDGRTAACRCRRRSRGSRSSPWRRAGARITGCSSSSSSPPPPRSPPSPSTASPRTSSAAARPGIAASPTRSRRRNTRRRASPSRSAASSRSVLGARERVDMPRARRHAPGGVLAGDPRLRLGRALPAGRDGVSAVADRLNRFQFLTIRRYLTLVFGALVTLLLVLALWP